MSFNPNVTPTKITYEGDTLLDLTGDTVTADKLASGYTAHNSSGQAITGTMTSVTVNSLSVTENGTYTAPAGTAYSPVTVNVTSNTQASYQVNANGHATRLSGQLNFNNIITIGSFGLAYAFNHCSDLTGSILFPSLSTVDSYGIYFTFNACTGVTDLSFPLLSSVGLLGLAYAFYGCTGLTNVSFPSLTTVDNMAMYDTFVNCTNITAIHFKASAQSTIEGLTGYYNKFGATNATIYFDL